MSKEKTEDSQVFWKIATGVLVIILAYLAFFRGQSTVDQPSLPSQPSQPSQPDQPQLANTSNDPSMALTIVKHKDCTLCDTSQVEGALKKIFPTTTITYLDYESKEGKALVQKINTNTLPLYAYDSALALGANFAQASQAFLQKGDYYIIPTEVVGPNYIITPPSVDNDPVKGKPDAPVTIIEFSDFQCPFCAKFYQEAYPQIIKEYVDTGKVKLVYRDYPLGFHPNAQKAAEASECAHEQNKFWEMHDKLFENQESLSEVNYKKWATELGMDSNKFNDCLDTGKYEEEVQKDLQAGSDAGVSGTPGFFVNHQIISGAVPFAVFKEVIDAELN